MNTDNRKLTVTITPEMDVQKIMDAIKQAVNTTVSMDLATSQSVKNATQNIIDARDAQSKLGDAKEAIDKANGVSVSSKSEQDAEREASKERRDKTLQLIHKGIQQGFQMAVGAFSTMQGFIQQIYQKIRASSEFLQTVESLFQLGMTLLFMPLGNALAEVILPSMLDFVDGILGMWESFEEFAGSGSLDDMLDYIFTTGLEYIAKLFQNIGATLSNQGGILGTIGVAIKAIGTFLEGDAISILNDLVTIMTGVMNHIGLFISLYVGYKTAELALSGMGIYGELTGASFVASTVAIASLSAFALGALGTGTYLESNGIPVFANGGEVKSDGSGRGQIVRVAEWEDEYIIPKSKAGGVGGNMTINNYFSGYNEDQLINKINDTISTQIAESRYRSTY